MKTLNLVFTDTEFKKMDAVKKHESTKLTKNISWRNLILIKVLNEIKN